MKRSLIAVTCTLLTFGSLAFAEKDSHGNCMEKCDTNKDGKISKEEFLSKKEERFKKADINGDGFLDTKEHEALMDKMKDHHKGKGSHDGHGSDD